MGRSIAVVLAAGRGKRMNSQVQKQYLMIQDKPVLYYSMRQFEDCPFIDEIILVTGESEIGYCRKEIVEKFGFYKVRHIVAGGRERYHSVYQGLQAAENCSYIYIHDGARPFISQEMLKRLKDGVEKDGACVAGMPVKDTIKISDEKGFGAETPERSKVWMVQTPQVFEYDLIKTCYDKIIQWEDDTVTDDAMVVEKAAGKPSRLVEGSYENVKITTPEDLDIARAFMTRQHL